MNLTDGTDLAVAFWLGVLLIAAGVWVLAGFGWALVTLGAAVLALFAFGMFVLSARAGRPRR